jgi:hypothetical protein
MTTAAAVEAKAKAEANKVLLDFLERRHPEYNCHVHHWNFCEATYEGGRDWFEHDIARYEHDRGHSRGRKGSVNRQDHNGNIFKYLKEGLREYRERVRRAYRFNHTREATDLVQKYIFKPDICRKEDDAPPEITDFWANATLTGLNIKQFMKLVSTKSSILGKPWIFTDSTKTANTVSIADAKAAGARVYAYIVKPQDILDIGFDTVGAVNWVLVRTWFRDDLDPINATGCIEPRYVLWDRQQAHTWRIEHNDAGGGKLEVPLVEDMGIVPHGLGVVPGFPVDHVISENRYVSPSLVDDIAYLDRAVANYLSNLDAIIQDQTFSQLAIPAQAIMPGTAESQQLQEMGTKRVFAYDGEGGGKPEFLSPDPKQASVIITVINKIISEIYSTIGMAGERTKEDNATGIDNSSGVAKAYDFERMNSLLTSKADSLQDAENKLVNLVLLWNKKPALNADAELVQYPDTFDTRSLFDEFTVAERLALVEAPDTVRREQMKQVVDKLFPDLAADLRKTMQAEMASWPPVFDLQVTATIGGSGQPVKFPATGSKVSPAPGGGTPAPKNAAQQNRQGQNNKGATK